jgi:D-alanyl-lipoteichoic acid acyltransferase DltB (MBOAT superfamily)
MSALHHFLTVVRPWLEAGPQASASLHLAHKLVALLGYLLAGRWVMRHISGVWRELWLAVLNVGGVYVFLFNGQHHHYGTMFFIYLALVVLQFVVLQLFAGEPGWLPWIAFFTPLAILAAVRYVPGSTFLAVGRMWGWDWRDVPALIGLSYLAFRCSRLVLEIRNGTVQRPAFLEYFNFAFFLPTMSVGPINSYANYRRGFASPYDVPVGRAGMRMLVGLVKFYFLGGWCGQLAYSALLLDDHPHHWMDLPVAMVFYYLFLYCNFSGFCDLAIGAAAFIGIPVPENFDNPFIARNVKEFWNRWHITLSGWMRDVVFSPLSKFLVRVLGASATNHAIAITIFVVFLLIGIWHGVGWNYAAYGAVHALALVVNHYYTLFLKRKLGRDGFKAYNENPWIRAVGTIMTFGYCAASMMFFANTFPQIQEIFSALR